MEDSVSAELRVPTAVSEEPASLSASTGAQLTPEELVAKAIAPVKREYLRPPPVRSSGNNVKDAASTGKNDGDNKAAPSSLVKEKKSKRQMKRERRQEQKSTSHLCPEIAKTGDVSSCRYSDKCRFSHDIEAFKSQKPADLDGECPFSGAEQLCPYGLACRFAGTHKEGVPAGSSVSLKKCSEMNGLNKDVQKLLWKNKMKFPKADAKLKELGLLGHGKSKSRVKEEKEDAVSNDSVADRTCCSEVNNDMDADLDIPVEVPEENGQTEGTFSSDESRPLKKPKSMSSENCHSDKIDNGACMIDATISEGHTPIESEVVNDIVLPDSDASLKSHPREKKLIDFRDKLYLAPLTTVGNLPFRRVCKVLGADVTCGEMAMCTNLLQGQASEWALLRRHSSEDLFGVQICGAYPDTVSRAVELIDKECVIDFIDINMGCPIDIVVNKGAGSALLMKPMRMKSVVETASGIVDTPITIKVRTGYFEGKNRIDSLIADIGNWGASAVTVHGRTRQQRYSKLADWEYINRCSSLAPDSLQVIGNGDVFSYADWNRHKVESPKLATCMIARGALIKPWLFTEIKEQRNWDITSGERLNILKNFVHFGLEHWGSDTKGVETTRHFLLEWLSYTCRYIPVGLLDVVPQRLNWRPPSYFGRDDLETLMSSDSAADWIKISEMLLGKVPDAFSFAPKHKSNAYDRAENG
ncbi:tRNA-dihydrouridine(47) synthase [NAD(P)(+)]-like [Cucurbita pepo subsp. pepo]|uniref:tRNA-dihydrouridine(47) synthase [NAD(P)(+)]-like n=1 Tax=Cucurbita pepo subsp. pepo TaxID=3664 RepID=UPI000C9D949F|nr:tRNA-dihydrouridine(47) synthase [NAD(P)(+)]-like [Cucurbita pepo subsp. pepo]